MPTAEHAPTTSGEDLIARLRTHQVTTIAELHAINGEPQQRFLEKHTSYLTPLLERFITAAPFFLIATADADGNCDVSPKGDPAGGVRILDRRTIAIPDRLGNRRADGHRNIITNPHIGLIFMIPPVDETVRVNGRAFLTADPDLLETMKVKDRPPKLGHHRRDRRGLHALRAGDPPLHSLETGKMARSGHHPHHGRHQLRAEGPPAARRIAGQTAGRIPIHAVLIARIDQCRPPCALPTLVADTIGPADCPS